MKLPQSVARVIRWVRGQPSAQKIQRPQPTSPILEKLEDRCIMAVLSGGAAIQDFLSVPQVGSSADFSQPTQGEVGIASDYWSTWSNVGLLSQGTISSLEPSETIPLDGVDWANQTEHESVFGTIEVSETLSPDSLFFPNDAGGMILGPAFGDIPADDSLQHSNPPAPISNDVFRPSGMTTPSGSGFSSDSAQLAVGSNADSASSDPLSQSAPSQTTTDTPSLRQLSSATQSSQNTDSSRLLVSGNETFRISRATSSDAAVEVRYSITAFGATQTASIQRTLTLPAGASHADVPKELPSIQGERTEIVTITILNSEQPYPGRSATVFVSGKAQSCSEAALFGAYNEGRSSEAFSVLVERNRESVLRTCHQVLGNWHDAEDVSQMVFIALAQRQLKLQTTLAGWLRTVARNASIAFLRSRSRRTRHEQAASKPATVQQEENQNDLREELDSALKQIAAPLQEAVRLRYLEGWSQKEAAQMVGCPRGTLSQRAAQGVRTLRDILAPQIEAC
jgi:RNA polymerase sigma-70 factor (ECF subfamily)